MIIAQYQFRLRHAGLTVYETINPDGCSTLLRLAADEERLAAVRHKIRTFRIGPSHAECTPDLPWEGC
jgi:hypothetical protein